MKNFSEIEVLIKKGFHKDAKFLIDNINLDEDFEKYVILSLLYYSEMNDEENFLIFFKMSCELCLDDHPIFRDISLLSFLDERYSHELLSLYTESEKVEKDKKSVYEYLDFKFNAKRFMNIGGGQFVFPEWLNVDINANENYSIKNNLTGEEQLPIRDLEIELVYSSHCLEHLNDQQVSFVLSEAHRVLHPSGALIIKIPDFDWLLDSYRSSTLSSFSDELWNFPCATETWSRKGIPDSIENRCAYLFCGYWNEEFGNLFGSYNTSNENAYNGPPKIEESHLKRMLNSLSPKEFVNFLLENSPDNVTFNHQNAWGYTEFCRLLNRFGFKLVSSDKEKISTRFSNIPGVMEMYDISSYYFFVKVA